MGQVIAIERRPRWAAETAALQFDGYSPLIGSAAEGARVNQVTDKILTGTLGELLVQARLLQYGVQAAPPIKDSGNDLIAVNGNEFRAVSVRTTTTGTYGKPDAARLYHVLAVVYLVGDDRDVSLDHSEIFLIPRAEVAGASTNYENLGKYKFSRQLVEQLFGQLPD